jgi:hypothetical protein
MPGDEGEPAARIFRGRRSDFLPPKGESSVERGGEGGIRTLDGGIHPHNALAGRRLQPLGHFSAPARGYPTPRPASGYASPSPEGWQSGRMRRSRKPFRALGSDEGSNPSPSADRAKPQDRAGVLALPAARFPTLSVTPLTAEDRGSGTVTGAKLPQRPGGRFVIGRFVSRLLALLARAMASRVDHCRPIMIKRTTSEISPHPATTANTQMGAIRAAGSVPAASPGAPVAIRPE